MLCPFICKVRLEHPFPFVYNTFKIKKYGKQMRRWKKSNPALRYVIKSKNKKYVYMLSSLVLSDMGQERVGKDGKQDYPDTQPWMDLPCELGRKLIVGKLFE